MQSIMRKFVFVLFAVNFSTMMFASEQTDSISKQLDEVVVEAAPVMRMADKMIYFGTKEARKHSNNGVSFLRNLHIPEVVVDPVNGGVSSPLGNVQIRINGRQTSEKELASLMPSDIVKVEFYDNPGVAYQGAGVVVNFIVKHRTTGGEFMGWVKPWLKRTPLSGDASLSLKLNSGRSQFGLSLYDELRNRIKIWREYDERIKFPDGNVWMRKESPDDGINETNDITAKVFYSYVVPEKTYIYVDFGFLGHSPEINRYHGTMSSIMQGEENARVSDLSVEKTAYRQIPSISLYLEQQLGHNQMLVADAVWSYGKIKSRNYSLETPLTGSDADAFMVDNVVRSNAMQFGVKAQYIKRWNKYRFTGGLQWNGSNTKSVYEPYNEGEIRLRRNFVYGFAELMGMFGEFSAAAGIGVSYEGQISKESGLDEHAVTPEPHISLMWRRNWSALNLTAYYTSRLPNAVETSPVMQQVDHVIFSQGNPDLRAEGRFSTALKWGQNFQRVNSSIMTGFYGTTHNGISGFYRWTDDGRLLSSYDNNGYTRAWYAMASASVKVIPEWIYVSGYLRFMRTYTGGTGYRHTYSDWSGNVNLSVMHWGFQLGLMYSRNMAQVYSEIISRRDSQSAVMLSYNWKTWQFGISVSNPVGKFGQKIQQNGTWYNYEQTVRSKGFEKLVMLNVSYNLQWGVQKQSRNKQISASDEIQSLSAAGR